MATKKRAPAGAKKADGTLRKGFRYAKGGRIVKAKARKG
jgi:hypothetical protein